MSEPQAFAVYFESEAVNEEKLNKIRNYFQVRRKSGGGDCSRVVNFSGKVYKVDFKDKQAQQRVLEKREHRLEVGGSPLVLFVRDSPGPGPAPRPEPLRPRPSSAASSLPPGGEEHEVKSDSYLLQFFKDCAGARSELDRALQLLESSATFYPEKGIALFRSSLRYDDADTAEVWKAEVEGVYKEAEARYCCRYVCEAKMRLLLLNSCSLCQEEQDVKVYSEPELVVVVGTESKVEERLKHVDNCHVRLHGASLGQSRSHDVSVDKMKYRLVRNEIKQRLAEEVPNLKVTEEEGKLVLEGAVKENEKGRDIIEAEEKTVKDGTVKNASNHFVAFLNKAFRSGQGLSDFLKCGESVLIDLKLTEIKIFSLSAQEIAQTIEALETEFVEERFEVPHCSEVPVELQNSLKNEEKTRNRKGQKVCVHFSKNTVVLIGHAKEVTSLQAVVNDYILDQAKVEDRVVVPFPEMAQKLPELLVVNGVDFAGVSFIPSPSGAVTLEGPSSVVSQVKSRLEAFLQSLVRESIILDLPGALRYSQTPDGFRKLLDAASSRKCLIRLEESPAASEGEEVVARYFLKGGVQVIVYLGDITKQEADALVNAANGCLKHSGGVASALSKAAGPEVQKESDDLVKRYGEVCTGNVAVTGGGKLKCKKLLHAVGPTKHNTGGREKELLEETVKVALSLAESMNFESIALPCISAGIFGVQVDMCADAIVSAVGEFASVDGRCLNKITLIDNRREVVQSLRAQCDRMLQDTGAGDSEGARSWEMPPGAMAGGCVESVRVEIVQGTIENQKVDCVVCPMLGHGPTSTRVGQALRSVAGAALLTKFSQSAGGASQPGDALLVEEVPGLLSKGVVYLNLMKYSSQQQERAKKVLRQSIASTLVTCERSGFSSIVFPVTGPGGVLQFPHSAAALVLLQEIQAFELMRAAKGPRAPYQIRIVIHPKDKEATKALQAFQDAQKDVQLKGFTSNASPNHASFYRHLSSSGYAVTALMGSVKLQLVQGDIIHEKTDVIVNSTGFQTAPAGVSKAILTAAGPNIQHELGKVKPADQMCTTAAGLLGCKEIIHIRTDTEPQAIVKTCHKVLKLCERNGYTSVAFPAINTGIGKMDHCKVGKAMLDGMASVIAELSPKSLSLIRIIILQPPVFDAFKAELDSRFGREAPQLKLFVKMRNAVSTYRSSRSRPNIRPTKPQPAVFSAIGPCSDVIADLKKDLEGLVQQQLGECEFELQDLCRLDEMEVAAVQAKARSHGVSLEHSSRSNTTSLSASRIPAKSEEKMVILRGLKEDVLIVAKLVNKAIRNALSDDLKRKQEHELAQSIKWMFQSTEEDWKEFNHQQNYILEEGHVKKEVFVETTLKGNKVQVNLKALEATDCETGEKYILRRCEEDTATEFPQYWTPMAGETFKKVEVDQNSSEFQDIAQGFHKTAKHKIHKIERVQNHYQWCNYFTMRRRMEVRNGADGLGEKHLYHGTSADICHRIERDRFNRSYCGKNATRFGKGVYFAVNAEYSAQPSYSGPDAAGCRRMFVARVLTGRHTLGRSDMVAPPQRGDDATDTYDSLVDNLQNPSMFVIFHDDQAYQEYLITFS